MIAFVKKVIRETIGNPKTPDECVDALVRLGQVKLPEDLTRNDRMWLSVWFEDLLTHAQASARFDELFPDDNVPA